MKEQNAGRIVIITSILSTFVISLCASVSKIIPFFFVAALVALLLVLSVFQYRTFAVIKEFTQKTE
jgi:hypothetical protein